MYSLNENGSNLAEDAKYFWVQIVKVYQYRTNVYFFYLLKSICLILFKRLRKVNLYGGNIILNYTHINYFPTKAKIAFCHLPCCTICVKILSQVRCYCSLSEKIA